MDSRLKLTKKQRILVKRLIDTFNQLEKEKVGIIASYDELVIEHYYFYNASDVIDIEANYGEPDTYSDCASDGLISYIPPYEFPSLKPSCDIFIDYRDWVSVILPENKESKLWPLNNKMVKLKTELKKYQDAKDEADNNISRLIERHVAQEIIDEEMELIKTNKKQIADLKKEIKALRDEMNSIV